MSSRRHEVMIVDGRPVSVQLSGRPLTDRDRAALSEMVRLVVAQKMPAPAVKAPGGAP